MKHSSAPIADLSDVKKFKPASPKTAIFVVNGTNV